MEKAKWDMLECPHQRITLASNLASRGRLLTPYSAIFCPQSLQRINILALSRPRLPWQIYENKDVRDLVGKNVDTLCESIQGWLKPESGSRTLFLAKRKRAAAASGLPHVLDVGC
jgi:hypothetical protein